MSNENTLDTAIADALKTNPIEGVTVTDTSKTETESTTEEDKKPVAAAPKEDKKDNEDGLSESELKEAEVLYKGLKNPDKQKEIVAWFAQQHGYTKAEARADIKEINTAVKETVAEQPKDVVKSLKEKLGPEFDYLAEKLAPAIKDMIDSEIKEVRTRQDKNDEEKLLTKYQSELDSSLNAIGTKFYSEGDIPQDVQMEMSKVMDVFTDTGKMTPAEYMESVHHIAVGRLGKSPLVQKATNQKTTTEKKERASDTLPKSNPLPNLSTGGVPSKKGIDAAIELGIQQLAAQGINFN